MTVKKNEKMKFKWNKKNELIDGVVTITFQVLFKTQQVER